MATASRLASSVSNVLLIVGEVVQMAALNIQHANALPAEHQRNGQFGTHGFNGIDIARILRDVADTHGMARGRRRSGNSLPDGNAQIFRQARRIADRKAMLQDTIRRSSTIRTPNNS